MRDFIIRTRLLFIALLAFALMAHATNSQVDSLLKIVGQNKANAEVYNQLAQQYWFIDMEQSKAFGAKALHLATTEKDSAQIGFAFNRLGTGCMYLGNLDSAKIYYDKSADIFKSLKMYNAYAGANTCCAKIYENKFDYENAILEYKKSIDIFETLEPSEYYVQTLLLIANLHAKIADFDNAQYYFYKALDNKSHLNNYDQIILYNYIGINYQNKGDFRNAIKNFEKAFQTCNLADDNIALAITYVNTAKLYIAWNKQDVALEYLQKGYNLSKTAKYEQHCRTILALMGKIYYNKNELERATNLYTELLNHTENSTDTFNEAQAYQGLANVYSKTELYTKAIEYTNKSLKLYEKVKRPFYIANSNFLLASSYFTINNHKKTQEHLTIATVIAEENSFVELETEIALLQARFNKNTNKTSSGFYEKHIALKDSIFAENNQKLLAKYQVELSNLEKDFQLKEAEHENELKETKLRQQKRQIAYISAICVLLVLGVFVIASMYLKKQKANRVLFLKNKELLEKENKPRKTEVPSKISKTVQDSIIYKLKIEFDENKIHLRNDITLHSLSKILETNSSYLSKIIKTNYHTTFSSYLNKYRIIDAQRMILDEHYTNYTIDAISQECGYNSKSTFNKVFKEITGLTPNEYKRQNMI